MSREEEKFEIYLKKGVWRVFFLVVCLLATACFGLEEEEREIYLQPRNFNPHPYQTGYNEDNNNRRQQDESDGGGGGGGGDDDGGGNTGPVLFPKTPPAPLDDPNGNSRNIILNKEYNSHPIDRNPYASVVRKHKYKQAGRFFNDQENKHASTEILKALGAHAARILKKPIIIQDEDVTKKNYAFSYKVKDNQSGDDFSHIQEQNSATTNGEYRVKLPDGRVQIVSYVADKNGYKADVKYSENENSNPSRDPTRVRQIRPTQIVQNHSNIKTKPPLPSSSSLQYYRRETKNAPSYDYFYPQHEHQQQQQQLEEESPNGGYNSNLQVQLRPLFYGPSQHPTLYEDNEGIPGLKNRNSVQLIVTSPSSRPQLSPHHQHPPLLLPSPSVPSLSLDSKKEYENDQLKINPYLILYNDIVPSGSSSSILKSSEQNVAGLSGNIHDRQRKVEQINEHNLNSGKVGKFIGSILNPYTTTLDSSKGFHESSFSLPHTTDVVVAPAAAAATVATRYSQVQINTPDFKLIHTQNHDEKF